MATTFATVEQENEFLAAINSKLLFVGGYTQEERVDDKLELVGVMDGESNNAYFAFVNLSTGFPKIFSSRFFISIKADEEGKLAGKLVDFINDELKIPFYIFGEDQEIQEEFDFTGLLMKVKELAAEESKEDEE